MTAVTAEGQVRGKLTYMAPEQIRGKNLTHKADIFSLGAVFFELATGQKLYTDAPGHVLATNVAQARFPRPSTVAPITEQLEEIIVEMLQADPAGRPDAKAVLRKLTQLEGYQDRSLELADFLAKAMAETAKQPSSAELPAQPPAAHDAPACSAPAPALRGPRHRR